MRERSLIPVNFVIKASQRNKTWKDALRRVMRERILITNFVIKASQKKETWKNTFKPFMRERITLDYSHTKNRKIS